MPTSVRSQADIAIYVNLGSNLDYWRALATVCADEIDKIRSSRERHTSGPRRAEALDSSIREVATPTQSALASI